MSKNIDILHFAKLVHISLSDNELSRLEQDIRNSLELFESLPEFDDVKLEIDTTNPIKLREDKVAQKFTQEEMLSNAPKQSGGCIVIPKTVE